MYSYSSFFSGFPHSSYSPTVSGSDASQHRVDDVHERDLRDDGMEEVGPHVRDRAHEEAARASALDDEPVFRRDLLRDERLRGRDEVGERVLLLQHLPVVVPLLAHLAAAADVRDGDDDAPVEEAQAVRGKRDGIRKPYEP